ncbi:MAG: SIS domain-containing protein [Desulfobacterales bacterium]
MNIANAAQHYLNELKETLDNFNLQQVEKIVNFILRAYEDEKQIFIMGNGGSASTASHFACDLNKGCCSDLEKKIKMICLNDNIPTLLAFANDVSYDVVFVEQLKNLFHPGDLVIGISGSGNSENVIKAIEHAKQNKGKTIGFSGFSGGKLAQMVDVPFVAQVYDMQKVEDCHVILVHVIMQYIYSALHPGLRGPK